MILLHLTLLTMSSTTHHPSRLDVRAFAHDAAQLQGDLLLQNCERLALDLYGLEANLASKTLLWKARGEQVAITGGAAQSWLHLEIEATLPMQCQRCLQGMDASIHVQRSFRFVRDEREADAQDDEAEEDLLVASKQFDLLALIEDELIMALPFAPAHEVCPAPVKLQSSSEEFEAALEAKPNAFAALGVLKKAKK
jgi:uncharacterized protein